MQSFWRTLKNELVYPRHDKTRDKARRDISEYSEIFCNRQGRHSRLGNRSPAAFAQLWARQLAAEQATGISQVKLLLAPR